MGGITALANSDTPASAGSRDEEMRDLMRRYQGGDPAAVDQLVARLSPSLLAFLSRPGLPRSDAEDMLQECWMRIHRSRHTYRAEEPLLPWIFAIARHTRLDAFRRRQRQWSRETLVADVPEPPAPAATPQGPDIAALLERLPESQREVLIMLKVSGMSLEEIARATASSVGAIKQKAHRAYTRLRQILEEGS